MNTNSTNKLIEILELKQIKFDKGEKSLFRKYSYYQVINAYKNLFVKDIEYITNYVAIALTIGYNKVSIFLSLCLIKGGTPTNEAETNNYLHRGAYACRVPYAYGACGHMVS